MTIIDNDSLSLLRVIKKASAIVYFAVFIRISVKAGVAVAPIILAEGVPPANSRFFDFQLRKNLGTGVYFD